MLFMGLYKVELQKRIENEFLVCISTFSPRPGIGLSRSLGSKAKRFIYRYDGSFVTSIVQLDIRTISASPFSKRSLSSLSRSLHLQNQANLSDKRKEMTCPNVHCPWRDLNV